MRSVSRTHWSWLVALSALAGGCAEPPPQTVLILAAASTQDALAEAADEFETETGLSVKINAAASNALAAQILAGAPADLFLAASPVWTDEVQKAGLTAEVRPLLGGTLVLIVPRGNPAEIDEPGDLLSERVSHVAFAGETVPAGIYAQQALRSDGVYSELLRQNRIARAQDVRIALSYVERGEAEAGVVYETDARLSDQVEIVHRFSPSAHDPILYPLALLKSGDKNLAARRFYEYLKSEAATAVFQKHGFAPAAASAGEAP